MATQIPARSVCVSRMTNGEKRFSERLEDKLDADYLIWYDVPVGPNRSHPDFMVLHPRRGLLILEVKDWKRETILHADKKTWDILANGIPKRVASPLEQARHYAQEAIRALERDPQLIQPEGRYQGKPAFPWSYGVIFAGITRRQFEEGELGNVIEPHRALCSDEWVSSVEPEAFQSRLWDMFPFGMRGALSLPQIDRIRWILFPEIRVPETADLFADQASDASEDKEELLPDIMRVMDLQQEQLARSLGDGHRVIHGVAGSGKTMILGYRAEYLAQAATSIKPILILCYNRNLASKLKSIMLAKHLTDRVQVATFHSWCARQLQAYGQDIPEQASSGQDKYAELVDRMIRGVDRQMIPSGQYRAILIDEGHDFAPEWLKLIVQMVDPDSNSLLVLYDDAQSIYKQQRQQKFSFKSVGIQAQGRTTILKLNYRNTRQILQTASAVANDLLTEHDTDDDGTPVIHPISCGRDGEAPLIIHLPDFPAEATKAAELLASAHEEEFAWKDMAILCRHWEQARTCASILRRRGLPLEFTQAQGGSFNPEADSIKVMTMHASKGLEFPVVVLVGVGEMPAADADVKEEERLFYVAATRATKRLVITASGDREGVFANALPE